MLLKLAVAPSPLNTLLENAPMLSKALLNKPVDCVLTWPLRLALAVRGDLTTSLGCSSDVRSPAWSLI